MQCILSSRATSRVGKEFSSSVLEIVMEAETVSETLGTILLTRLISREELHFIRLS
jgi:hypothetical protein